MIFSKKKDVNYFTILNSMADCFCRASVELKEMLHDYTDVAAKAKKVHDIEHEADKLLHGLVHELNRAFITPIDREDILHIGNNIDSITDLIEEVANLFDMLSIKEVEKPALEMSNLVVLICEVLARAIKEFEDFRKSKKLADLIIEVNGLEEKGDSIYRSTLKALYNNEKMPILDIAKWKEIYDNMERIFDSCEEVADLLESSAVKNR